MQTDDRAEGDRWTNSPVTPGRAEADAPGSAEAAMAPGSGAGVSESVPPTPASAGAGEVDDKGRPLAVVPPRVPWLAVGVFVLTAVVLGWLVCLPLWIAGEGLDNLILVQLCGQALMLTPLLATIVALFVQRRRARHPLAAIPRYLGMWPLRPFGRVIGVTAVTIIATFVFVSLCYFLSAALGWLEMDLAGLSGFKEQLALLPGLDTLPLGLAVAIYLAIMVFNSLTTAIFAFGEEIGWRGWLLTSLRPLGVWPALILICIVWGLWHAPLILLGYNFSRPDITGLGLMVLGCLGLSFLFGWLRLRTGSVWPAVFAHGALNGSSSLLLGLFIAADAPTPDMALVAAVGAAGWIISAVIVAVLVLTGQFRKRPELGVPPRRGGQQDGPGRQAGTNQSPGPGQQTDPGTQTGPGQQADPGV